MFGHASATNTSYWIDHVVHIHIVRQVGGGCFSGVVRRTVFDKLIRTVLLYIYMIYIHIYILHVDGSIKNN